MNLHKKVIIWDLDNTLYDITPEFADMLDEAMAKALVEDLGIKMDLEEAKTKVKESYLKYRDGGHVFYEKYNINPIDLFFAYHERTPVEKIIPYNGLLEKLKRLPFEQYIFTYSSNATAKRILKQIGLDEFFEGRLYTVEDYNFSKKNDNAEVYQKLCQDIGVKPEDCIFVDDSYSNLEYAKKAGMTTVRIYYNQNSAKDNPYIDHAFKGINSMLDEVIEKLS